MPLINAGAVPTVRLPKLYFNLNAAHKDKPVLEILKVAEDVKRYNSGYLGGAGLVQGMINPFPPTENTEVSVPRVQPSPQP